MNKKWFVIINPVSGGKYAPKLWNKILPYLATNNIVHDAVVTEYIDHASILVKKAVGEGYTHFMIIGGDGTANDVINGIFSAQIDTKTITVAMLPAGTGNDWVRTIGAFKSVSDIPKAIIRNETFLHDAGLVSYKSGNQIAQRYFINIAGLGFEGHVAKNIYESKGWLKGTKLQYQLSILKSLFIYKHTSLTITVDDSTTKQPALSVAAGICKFNGGGLKQLPDAVFDDGLLDMTIIGSMRKWQMVVNLPKLQSGAHVKVKSVSTYRGKNIKIDSEPPIYIDVDGEFIGTTPVSISILPQSINVLKF